MACILCRLLLPVLRKITYRECESEAHNSKDLNGEQVPAEHGGGKPGGTSALKWREPWSVLFETAVDV